MRRRTAATLVAGLALAAAGATAPVAAHAATSTPDDAIVRIDATTGEVIQVNDEVFGTVTVIPGSSHQRTLRVKNAGPSDATLTVSIVNAKAIGHEGDAAADSFHGNLLVNGIPAATHTGAETVVETVNVARNASTDIALDVALPRDTTGGNTAKIGPREFSFDVRLKIAGDTPDDPSPSPSPTAPTSPTSPTPPTRGESGPVTQTGGALAETNLWLLAGAAALAVVAAVASRPLVAAKRRNDSEPTR